MRLITALNLDSSGYLNSEHQSEFYTRYPTRMLAAIAHRIRGAGAGLALDSEGRARRKGRADTGRPSSRASRPGRAPGADADRPTGGRQGFRDRGLHGNGKRAMTT